MKGASKMKLGQRLQLLDFAMGRCSYIPDKESSVELRRLDMLVATFDVQDNEGEAVRTNNAGNNRIRSARTNS
jgi:hypothetical protein